MSEPKERIHYDGKRIEQLDPKHDYGTFGRRDKRGNLMMYKPKGLWYSAPVDEDGWEDWCRSESFAIDELACRHRLTLDLDAIYRIRTVEQLDDFHNKWIERIDLGPSTYQEGERVYHYQIRWNELQESSGYKGIEIAPYQWERRLAHEFIWYYGWDCSSGCVWDLSAVLDWEPLP